MNDGVAIQGGLKEALSNKKHVNKVPTIAGSTRDEVKIWLAFSGILYLLIILRLVLYLAFKSYFKR